MGIVAESWSADIGDAVLGAVDDEPVQMLTAQPNAVCRMVCSSAIVVSAGTSSRLQTSGLMPCTTTRS